MTMNGIVTAKGLECQCTTSGQRLSWMAILKHEQQEQDAQQYGQASYLPSRQGTHEGCPYKTN